MINFRLKIFSSPITKAVYGINKAGNKINQVANKSSLWFRRLITPEGSAKRLGAEAVARVSKPASVTSIARKAISQKDKFKNAINPGTIVNKVESTLNTANHVLGNPGVLADRGVKLAVSSPIAFTGEVADNAISFGVPLITRSPKAIAAAVAAPVRVAGIGAEALARKKIPAYARVTDKLGNMYEGSAFSRGLRRISGQDVQNLVRTIPIGVV